MYCKSWNDLLFVRGCGVGSNFICCHFDHKFLLVSISIWEYQEKGLTTFERFFFQNDILQRLERSKRLAEVNKKYRRIQQKLWNFAQNSNFLMIGVFFCKGCSQIKYTPKNCAVFFAFLKKSNFFEIIYNSRSKGIIKERSWEYVLSM